MKKNNSQKMDLLEEQKSLMKDNQNLKNHLLFLIHGFGGNYTEFYWVEKKFKEYFEKENYQKMQVYSATSNSCYYIRHHFNTSDGIKQGGQRLLQECLKKLQENQNIDKISIIGSSLGGLYGRYLVGELYKLKQKEILNQQFKFMNFITLATPHLGVSSLIPKILETLSIAMQTTRDLTLKNNVLEEISSGDYIEGLKQFKQLVCYAPILKDFEVSYETAAFTPHYPQEYVQYNQKKQNQYFKAETHIIKESFTKSSEQNHKSKDDKKYYESNSKKKQLDFMTENLKSLNWRRVDVLLNHFLLVNWDQNRLGFLWPWNKYEKPTNRFDVLNHLVNNFAYD